MPDIAFIILGWFMGGLVNGIAGFGAAMVAMPLISPFIEMSQAVPSCVLIVLLLNCQVTWTFRNALQFDYIKGILIGAVPGVLFSIAVLRYVSEQWLTAGMGLFIFLYGLWSITRDKQIISRVLHPAWSYLAGLFSSTLGMAFGFNGPPLAAYVAQCGCDAKSVKGILGSGFVITGVFIVSAKALTGQINHDSLFIFAMSTPAVLFGSKLGIFLSSFLPEAVFRKLFLIALTLMGGKIFLSACC